jgi:stage III sporulation protein AG
MDWVNTSESFLKIWKKYRYILAMLLVGMFFMLIPQEKSSKPEVITSVKEEKEKTDLQSELEALLCQMEGAGKVKVLLTLAAGERSIYQSNESMDQSDTSTNVRKETVILTDAGRAEEALVQQTIPEIYLGAVILCQGANSASVRLSIIEAVSKATGLDSNHISVLKMK